MTGLTKENECIECYPGSICISDLSDPLNPVKAVSDCPAGYYCVGNLNSDALPANCAGGDTCMTDCPQGHYCPTGSYEPIKCEPGTYNDVENQSECSTCPLRSYCDESGLTAPKSCFDNGFEHWYCPEGSINPEVCPAGTYGNNQEECLPCATGNYCQPNVDGTGQLLDAGVAGLCDHDEGFICYSGSFSPRPIYEGFEYIQRGSSTFN